MAISFEEQQIVNLLKGTKGTLYSAKELGRYMDRKRFHEDPNWARPMLENLVEEGLIEKDQEQHYFIDRRSA